MEASRCTADSSWPVFAVNWAAFTPGIAVDQRNHQTRSFRLTSMTTTAASRKLGWVASPFQPTPSQAFSVVTYAPHAGVAGAGAAAQLPPVPGVEPEGAPLILGSGAPPAAGAPPHGPSTVTAKRRGSPRRASRAAPGSSSSSCTMWAPGRRDTSAVSRLACPAARAIPPGAVTGVPSTLSRVATGDSVRPAPALTTS